MKASTILTERSNGALLRGDLYSQYIYTDKWNHLRQHWVIQSNVRPIYISLQYVVKSIDMEYQVYSLLYSNRQN